MKKNRYLNECKLVKLLHETPFLFGSICQFGHEKFFNFLTHIRKEFEKEVEDNCLEFQSNKQKLASYFYRLENSIRKELNQAVDLLKYSYETNSVYKERVEVFCDHLNFTEGQILLVFLYNQKKNHFNKQEIKEMFGGFRANIEEPFQEAEFQEAFKYCFFDGYNPRAFIEFEGNPITPEPQQKKNKGGRKKIRKPFEEYFKDEFKQLPEFLKDEFTNSNATTYKAVEHKLKELQYINLEAGEGKGFFEAMEKYFGVSLGSYQNYNQIDFQGRSKLLKDVEQRIQSKNKPTT